MFRLKCRRKYHLFIAVVLPIWALVFLVPFLQASNDALDPTFGNAGIVTTSISVDNDDRGQAVAVQPDGKIIVAGYSGPLLGYHFAVARYTISGTLDTSFGSGGAVTTTIGNIDWAYDVALQDDGKIVVAGTSDSSIALARYTVTGTLDTDFGTGGIITTTIGDVSTNGFAMAIQSDGKIVVAGNTTNSSNFEPDLAVVRYTISGTLDTSFGSSGKVVVVHNSSWDYGNAVAIQPDDKIIVAGDSSGVMAIVRLNSNGDLDNNFGQNGRVAVSIPNYWLGASAVALQSNDKIIVVGNGTYGGNSVIALTRLTITGSQDINFGDAGIVTTTIAGHDYGRSVVIQPNDEIIVAGSSSGGSKDNFAAVRYIAAGHLDLGFGLSGVLTTSVNTGNDFGFAAALQPDAKLVVAGYSNNGNNDDFALVRYQIHGTNPLTATVYLPMIQR